MQYVSNIYKYYIAYKLTLDRAQKRERRQGRGGLTRYLTV